jgi:hypothetical protein
LPVKAWSPYGTAQRKAGELVAPDDALQALALLDERQSRIVELRYFDGPSVDETAEILGVSKPTVRRDWATARAILDREIATARPCHKTPAQNPRRAMHHRRFATSNRPRQYRLRWQRIQVIEVLHLRKSRANAGHLKDALYRHKLEGVQMPKSGQEQKSRDQAHCPD